MKESQDHKGLVELVESTLSKFSSVQDVARRYASYVHLTSPSKDEGKYHHFCLVEWQVPLPALLLLS